MCSDVSPDLQGEDWDSPRAPLRRDDAKPDWSPPLGTSQRIRNRAIWAVALFTASVPPAFVALGVAEVAQDKINVAFPLAVGFWLLGLVCALWAAFPTLRYWETLPPTTRWLGALPMLSVSLFFSAALIAALFV
jgi:hypothetical protein